MKKNKKKVTKKVEVELSDAMKAVKAATVPTDKDTELSMPQAAKLLGITQYAAYRILNYGGLKDRSLGSWLKFKTK